MEQREIMEQVGKLLLDNPAKFIKIRDSFDEILADHKPKNAQLISDREFERLRDRFRDIDVPLSWCINKDAVYQLYKSVSQSRHRDGHDEYQPTRKSAKPKKKGLFSGLFG